ncbi:phage/plasmid primase, P4 family [Streptosporangium canum]|uniref:phage/plasmid primase, P4 family n=1 Tax=Streptosporangium canum TaxID=324952 RepID=UPI0033B36BD7
MTNLHNAALDAHANNLCVIPTATDGSKRPAVPWKKYQTERSTREQVEAWFPVTGTSQYDGFGVVTGAVSGNLELLELEGRAVHAGMLTEMTALADASGLGELLRRVTNGYFDLSPGGGGRVLYRVDGPVAGNTKLARRLGPDGTIEVLAETRGEGGQVVVPPSGGRTHPNGRSWTMASGGFSTIATITPEERDALHHLAGSFDQMPTTEQAAPPVPPPARALFTQPAPAYDEDDLSPGDDYNAKTTWEGELIPRGWAKLYTDSAGVTYWRRPGKTVGISATTGRNGADNLFVFSTSTEFQSERPYDRFGALTLLEYGGDFSAAAKGLRAQGYGSQREHPRDDFTGLIVPGVDGNLATVTELQPRADRAHLQIVSESTHQHSDDRNALDLVDRFGDRIRYCADRGRWLAWDGARWQWCEAGGGIVREYTKRIARGLPSDDKADARYKQRSLTAVGLNGALSFAQTDARVIVSFDDLDAQPWELNTPSGIVDLRTGQIGPADASRLHTRVTLCAPDFNADPARWNEFLADTFGDDRELVNYLQRLVGYSATGYIGPHVLPFPFGSGGNGKGVFLESLMGVLGDYATSAPAGFLAVTPYPAHETELARLAGARMVICSETNEGVQFDEAKVKKLTGGDSITAKFMRQDHFTFKPTHHLWLMANHKPAVRSGGDSFWRRIRLIPFERQVPKERRIDDLQGILSRDHGPALMAWIARGAAEFAQHGLMEPDSVKAATDEYEKDQDSIARFIEECCRIGGGTNVCHKVTLVREAYERWCFVEGETPVSAKKLTQELSRRYGVESTKGGRGARAYTNITVTDDGKEEAPLPEAWGQ